MLREVRSLRGTTIHAQDGAIGHVDEILFDDEHWTVRYLVVDTGGWLPGRKVLISPLAFGNLDWDQHTLNLNLTREQIQKSPGVETDQPVSRQWERDYNNYYAWPYYWNGIAGWGPYWYPGTLFAQSRLGAEPVQEEVEDRARDYRDSHLRSTREVTSYGITATDGHLGHIQDFLIDDGTWRMRYLVLDTRDWWPGKKVLLPVDEIQEVNWPNGTVRVNVTREQVQNAPEWNHSQPIDRTFEDQLYHYYARWHPRDGERLKFELSSQLEVQDS